MNSIENNPVPPASGQLKYAWFDVPRTNPPKRSVSERAEDFHEIYGLFDEQSVREQASRCIQCAMPFCSTGCPLGNKIPEWLGLAAEGKFIEAAAVSRSTSNMPEICSRVCPQERLCEGMCALIERSDPIPIGAIEEFINEYAFAHGGVEPPKVMPNGMKVAVIGSGPAGLSCADELASRGYEVTVFESLPYLGGLLMGGVPAFKLEKSVVERRIAYLEKLGIHFRTNVTVGRDMPLRHVLDEFNAVFLGMGAQKARELDVPGAGLQGVYQALPFLVSKNLETATNAPSVDVKGKRVMVLGGGDTAMDSLRTAIRCGAKEAICVYRRDLANMPGNSKERRDATEEGAKFLFLTQALEILGEQGKVSGIRCIKTELGEPDAAGRLTFRSVPGSEFDLPADVVLVAFGFDPAPFPPNTEWEDIAVNETGGIVVDANRMTTLAKVFSAGATSGGVRLVTTAVRDGREGALGIHHYLSAGR
jgi:glutamate synthase (NADPH/NADH) small chain